MKGWRKSRVVFQSSRAYLTCSLRSFFHRSHISPSFTNFKYFVFLQDFFPFRPNRAHTFLFPKFYTVFLCNITFFIPPAYFFFAFSFFSSHSCSLWRTAILQKFRRNSFNSAQIWREQVGLTISHEQKVCF